VERVRNYCLESAGDQLRGIVTYADSEAGIAYVRDDLDRRYTDEMLANVTGVGQRVARALDRLGGLGPLVNVGYTGVRQVSNALVDR